MKVSTIILLFFVFATLTVISCSKAHIKCTTYQDTPVTGVQGPTSTTVNQAIDLVITYSFGNSCGKFERLQLTTSGNTTTITVIGKYEGCICSEVIVNGQTTYQFRSAQPGTYELKFFQSSGSFLTHTIVVN